MIDIVLDRDRLLALRDGATVVFNDCAVYRLTGPGALDCLQGLFTNDVVSPGDGHIVYGAFLTPKGRIIVDAWVLRVPTPPGLFLILPAQRGEEASAIFKRTLPPRLAQVEDLGDRWSVCWLLGGEAAVAAVVNQIEPDRFPPRPGAVQVLSLSPDPLWVARGTETAPFRAFVAGETAAVDIARKRLIGGGAQLGTADDLQAARVLAGWPSTGAEIGEKTLPQEARFDQIGGLSHTKGCYTGQETVARLHFRGHTNKEVRGLVWLGSEPLAQDEVVLDEKPVGTVHSTVRAQNRTIGLGTLRNLVKDGDRVLAGGRTATVVALPFGAADLGS